MIERARRNWGLYVTLGLVFLIALYGFFSSDLEGEGRLVLAFVLAVFVYVVVAFESMRFELTGGELVARFWPFAVRTKRGDIVSAEVARVPWWTGYGLRVWWRSIGFLSGHGEVLHVVRKRGITNLYLSVEHPEEWVKRLR